MKQEYTIRNAVFDTLFEMPKNTDFYFTDFLSEVRARLQANGNNSRPLDGTIQRAMCLMRRSFTIKCVSNQKSMYRIEEDIFNGNNN